MIESAEPDIPSVLAAFTEGVYTIEARAVTGSLMVGEATLPHTLLAPPTFTPSGGALVDPASATVTWSGVSGAEAYLLEIENDDLDANLTVNLPSTSFAIPVGWLVRDTEYEIGMATITAVGNLNFGESTVVTIP